MSSELGDFLRARRTDPRLRPADAGSLRPRRIAGLRREDVAAAAGISVDYYTRLEQGREGHPSDAVMAALARALRLGSDAEDHLYRLRGSRPISDRRDEPDAETLRERMVALVEALRPHPAYVLDRLSTMVAANPEGLALFEGFAEIRPDERNTCRYLMTDPSARETFVEWEDIARGAVAHLRAANATDLADPALLAFVGELRASSAVFGGWWDEHLVERRRTSIRHLRMHDGGVIERRHEVLYLPEDGLRMTVWLVP